MEVEDGYFKETLNQNIITSAIRLVMILIIYLIQIPLKNKIFVSYKKQI